MNCPICNKVYKTQLGLDKHKDKCKEIKTEVSTSNKVEITETEKMFIILLNLRCSSDKITVDDILTRASKPVSDKDFNNAIENIYKLWDSVIKNSTHATKTRAILKKK